MRKIADHLHVKTASLYYHVKDKEQLMQLLTDKISGELVWPETSLPWEEQVYQWADQFRKVLLAHKNAVELFNQTIAVGYERLTQIEKLYQLLVSAGFSDPQVPWIASMLKNYVLGFVAEEVRLNAIAGKEHSSYEELGDKPNGSAPRNNGKGQWDWRCKRQSYGTGENRRRSEKALRFGLQDMRSDRRKE
ncbi:TetR/AcrR family transcriptional regulator C-terminal domain-containing protein [Paenibacillus sedimenti]|uniref:TetR/AcrR family transcriptional regulator C-terminal domain-containing protein n=1 Tax=Paenibacillus sedimenti TaxID=2770274 RepID=A0A926QHT2_9BACL|nr:TetR/AcrR family transcriptional regulator C-terminal domain-containing protein [Paenibacillus sedimenti]MBD0378582.1 TetR/AcrR family transcriptional regulator C-terminal domain-containing protein [Paenibacillus sedimenti]